MVTQVRSGKAAGGVRTRRHGWARIDNPRPVIFLIGLGALLALASILAAHQARSSEPAAGTAAGNASGMAQQQFLDRNTNLPVGVAAGHSGSQQRQLATINQRDNGFTAAAGVSAGRPGTLGWVEARDYAEVPVSLPRGTRQQPHLYGIEMRDNPLATRSADSDAPCLPSTPACKR